MILSSFYQILLILFSVVHSVQPNEDPFLERHFKPLTIKLLKLYPKSEEEYKVSAQQVKDIRNCFILYFVAADKNFPDLNSILDVGTRCILFTIMRSSRIDWVSFQDEKPTRRELQDRIFREYKLKAEIGKVQYFSRPSLSSQPDVLAVKWIHNHQPTESISSVIAETTEREEKNSVKTTHSYGGSVTAGLSIPLTKFSVTASVGYKGSTSHEEENGVKKTFNLEDTVSVPPNSTVKVVWNFIQKQEASEWRAPIYVSGAAAIKFQSSGYTIDIRLLPLGELAKFFKEFTSKDTKTLQVNVEGVWLSSSGQSNVKVFQFPIKPDNQGLLLQDCPSR
uniref:Scol-BPFTx n=1 Tax=Scolopendra viridis TaxID=118503 RepID=A0A4D5RAM1_SCOVI